MKSKKINFLEDFCEKIWRGEIPFVHLWGKIDARNN